METEEVELAAKHIKALSELTKSDILDILEVLEGNILNAEDCGDIKFLLLD